MASGIDFGRSDDYAVLKTKKGGTFYFGYESALEDDEECEWRFTYTTPKGKEVCSLTLKDLGIDREYSYDDCAEVLCCGIGFCIQKGWLKPGDL